ncbi:hypothetical protein [Streptomyces bauhiniae]|uniref:Uncharacterized protein n=1 Tax=Streptomyces bauhiniae TaxID=2340725 RepID=A0A7K3QKB9_9ACTN|nr:hypothetical protein [Streptomyces bauhiniae]NEB90339.1 hypothetical protein [Streptomyces bauhiniae]
MSARNRRLPRDRAWPLTTTDITEHLGPLMTHVAEMRFLPGRDTGTIVLGAAWVAPLSHNYGRSIHPDAVGFRVDVHSVPAPQRAVTRPLLREQALPQLHDWITAGLAAGETWHLTGHERLWLLADGHLTHVDQTP